MLAAACAAVALALSGCAPSTTDTVLAVGQLEVADLRLLSDADADGVIFVAATVTNTSSVDRAFTVRWQADERTRERSHLIPGLETSRISAGEPFILSGVRAGSGDAVALTLAEGFFARADQPSVDIVVEVTAGSD